MMYHQGQSAMTGSHGPHQLSNAQKPITPGPTADPVLINRPILFSSGQFAGEKIRYELREIQNACLGRKYARVDRRPLDPPPVVLVQIWKYCPETGKEEEVNYEEVQTHGLLCTVDLFPVPAKTPKGSPPPPASTSRTSKTVQTSDGFVHFNPPGPSSIASLTTSPSYRPQSYGPTDIVHYYEAIYPLLESSKNTHSLVGATFVQPVLVELFGKKCIVFVFSDLAVKSEGTFTLRYRIFDLFSPNSDLRGSSQSPLGTYPATPSSLSISPTPSHVTASPPSPTSATGYVPSSSNFSQSPQSPQSQFSPPRSHFQLQSHQHAQQAPSNPYPDPSQDYTAPPPLPLQPRRRGHDPDDHMDQQAQFAPYESQTRIEPRERDASLSILAECWAKGSFRIFSTKEFPGLPASTNLTKQLARWGVRLNIRETERRRRRRSMVDEPEEESNSEGGPGNEVEGVALTKDQQRLSPRKTIVTNIKPRPALPHAQQQAHHRNYSSRSLPQPLPVQQRRFSSPHPSSSLGHSRHRPRQGSEGDEEYDEEPGRNLTHPEHKPDATEHSEYNFASRARNPSRSSLNIGLPAYYSLNPSGPFDPVTGYTHAGPNESHLEYSGTSTVTPQTHAQFTHSGLRSSISGTGVFEGPQSAPASAAEFSRYGGRKRNSDAGSSTSGGSGGSIGSLGELSGMAPSFVYEVGRRMDAGHGSQT